MPRRPSNRPTDAELEILSVLWELGPSTVRQVQEELARQRAEERRRGKASDFALADDREHMAVLVQSKRFAISSCVTLKCAVNRR